MSDRRAWLADWCPECRAAPGRRCRQRSLSSAEPVPAARLHAARGWSARICPTCHAVPGNACRTPSGRETPRPHAARLRAGRHELLWRDDVWQQLDRRDAEVALVPFSGRAGSGGTIGTISLSCRRFGELVDVDVWSEEELAFALAGPVWDRYAEFAGHPLIRGTVAWMVADRGVVIAGQRGGQAFEERVT